MSEYYKIGDVCKETDTQPYVLRFWESEFPQLAPRKNQSGQLVYTSDDVALIRRIKQLLYEEEYTIAGARQLLEQEGRRGRSAAAVTAGPAPARPRKAPGPRPVPQRRAADSAPGGGSPAVRGPARPPSLTSSPMMIERERYDAAVHEIQRLRRQVEELAAERDEQTARVEALEEALELRRQRALRVADRLERLLQSIEAR